MTTTDLSRFDDVTTPERLIEALAALPDLGPLDRARVCPALIDAAKAVISEIRGDACLEATTGEDALNQADVGRALRVHATKVGKLLRAAEARQAARDA